MLGREPWPNALPSNQARHSARLDRDAIQHHYDVSNAFYRLWLDRRMVYSCAYFRDDGDDARRRAGAKLDHICRKLRLAPGERFLDIGCGWGGLVCPRGRALRRRRAPASRCRRTSSTRDAARSRARGLAGRVRVELRDYLDLPEDALFDKIASVGMFEHVGPAALAGVFRHRPPRWCGPGACSSTTASPRPTWRTARSAAAPATSSTSTSFRTVNCRMCTSRCARWRHRLRAVRHRKPAAALRADAHVLVSTARGASRRRQALHAGARPARLARLPGGLRLRLRQRVDEHLPVAWHAPACGRPHRAAADARLAVPLALQ